MVSKDSNYAAPPSLGQLQKTVLKQARYVFRSMLAIEQFFQLATLVHLRHDVRTTNEFTIDI